MPASVQLHFLFTLLPTASSDSNIKVINRVDESINNLETLETINGHFISVNEISKILSNRAPFVNNEREKSLTREFGENSFQTVTLS